MSKVILITGGASGIGLATSILLVKKGYRVFATTRNLSIVRDVRNVLTRLGDGFKIDRKLRENQERFLTQIEFIEMDVNSDFSVDEGMRLVLGKTGNRLDVLINNAGFGIFGPVEEISLTQAKAQFETNVFGCLRTIKAVLPIMRYQKSGKIINVSSLAGEIAIPFQSHYSATKFAVEAFTEALRMELRPWNIMVCCVQPGDVNTSFNRNTVSYHHGKFKDNNSEIDEQFLMDKIPLSKHSPYFGRAKECWEVIIKNLPKSASPISVGRKIASLVDKKRLRARYSTGFFRQTIPVKVLKRFLPDRISQIAFEINYKIYKF